ncbi:MAG TPA: hypothetical protein VMW29_01145 [Candidatus Bathyarchaeia archaeon]|nr:hypothetical protein [Candidatus Bathyarchaeia archaeon]
MKLTIGVSGSAEGNITNELNKKAFVIGQEIAKAGAILVTGATTGLSFEAAKGTSLKKGLVIGISPAENKKEHQKLYREAIKSGAFSFKYFNLIIYTGFGRKGRNVVFIQSCDGVICIGGRIGTLNEFTIAYDENRPIGVLQPGGITEILPQIVKIAQKGNTPVIYNKDPKKLVKRLIEVLK